MQQRAPETPSEIVTAFQRGEITAFFQPKVHMATGEVVGAEALARWVHPERGVLAAGAFLADVEKANLMDALTVRMARAAITLHLDGYSRGRNIPVSFHAAPSTLRDPQFARQLSWLARDQRVDPASIIIEVTESALVEDDIEALKTLARLRMNGFGLALDNFGTATTTLKWLQPLPFTELKVDCSALSSEEVSDTAQERLMAVIETAQSLQLATVVKGVERVWQQSLLQQQGCECGQGYLFARPTPPMDFWPLAMLTPASRPRRPKPFSPTPASLAATADSSTAEFAR